MNLREELIQVAAVAVAWIEDIDLGRADSLAPHAKGGFHEDNVLRQVTKERMRQDYKWGIQHHEPVTWLAILAEEVGELSVMWDGQPPESLSSEQELGLATATHALERAARQYLELIGEDVPS